MAVVCKAGQEVNAGSLQGDNYKKIMVRANNKCTKIFFESSSNVPTDGVTLYICQAEDYEQAGLSLSNHLPPGWWNKFVTNFVANQYAGKYMGVSSNGIVKKYELYFNKEARADSEFFVRSDLDNLTAGFSRNTWC